MNLVRCDRCGREIVEAKRSRIGWRDDLETMCVVVINPYAGDMPDKEFFHVCGACVALLRDWLKPAPPGVVP